MASGQTVTLEAEVRTPNGYVSLQEVATIEGADATLQSRWRTIYLGPAPATYERDSIRQRMIQYGFDGDRLRFVGAPRVRVERGTPESERPRTASVPPTGAPPFRTASTRSTPKTGPTADVSTLIVRAIEDHARHWIGPRIDDVSVVIDSIDPPDRSRHETLSSAVVLDGSDDGSGSGLFQVRIETIGGHIQDLRVRARVRYSSRQLITRVDLPRGHIVTRDDLASRRVSIEDPTRTYPTEIAPLIGRRLRRALRAGVPLEAGMVETVPVVRRGRPVRVIYRGRGFTLETSARALSDGGIGEWIEIENQTARKRLRARVLGPATVVIDADPGAGD